MSDDDTPTRSTNTLAPLIAAVALCALLPGVAATTIAGIIATEYRKVRTSRWIAAAAATAIAAGIIAAICGTSPLWWLTTGAARTWAGFLLPANPPPDSILGYAAAARTAGWGTVIATQIITGTPIGLALTAAYSAWRSYARKLQNQIEGPEYSSQRPFGILDKLNRDRHRRLIADGHYLVIPEAPPGKDTGL